MDSFRSFSVDEGHVRVWLDEDDNFFIKAVDEYGDPVELSEDQLEELVAGMIRIRQELFRKE